MDGVKKLGRKPIDQGEPRQVIWGAIRAAGAPFTLNDVVAAAQTHRRTTQSYLDCLVAGGILEQVQGDYRMIKDAGHHAPRLRKDGAPVTQGGGTENMWRSMRMLGTFTPAEISATASNEHVHVTLGTSKSYCSLLFRTGYLRVEQKAEPFKGRQTTYRLIRNSGPKPPKIQRVKQVFDPNLKQVFAQIGAENVI